MDTKKQQMNEEPYLSEKENITKKKSGLFSSLFKKKDESNSSGLLETDLIKDEIEVRPEWKRDISGAFILFIVAFILLLEAYLFLSWWGEKKEVENSHYLEKEIAYIREETDKIRDDYNKSSIFQNDLDTVSYVLNQHIYWSNFFDYLEKYTLKKVYYNSFSGNLSGEYLLPATTDDVRAISYQSKTFLENEDTLSSEVSDEEIITEKIENDLAPLGPIEGVTPGDNSAEKQEKTRVNFNLKLILNKNFLNK